MKPLLAGATVLLCLLLSGCGSSRNQIATERTSVAQTVVAQITNEAASTVVVAALVTSAQDSAKVTDTPAPIHTPTASSSPEPSPIPEASSTPRPTPSPTVMPGLGSAVKCGNLWEITVLEPPDLEGTKAFAGLPLGAWVYVYFWLTNLQDTTDGLALWAKLQLVGELAGRDVMFDVQPSTVSAREMMEGIVAWYEKFPPQLTRLAVARYDVNPAARNFRLRLTVDKHDGAQCQTEIALYETGTSKTAVPATTQALEAGCKASFACGTVTADVANLREGPGTTFDRSGQARRGEALEITGSSGVPVQWWQVAMANGGRAWVSASLVVARNIREVPQVAASPAPTRQTSASVAPPGQNWTLVADSAADFPGGNEHNYWFYLWTKGRNNFVWEDMIWVKPSSCYQDPDGRGLEICRESIKTNSSGDVGVQWKASRGGTYRFEWDSPLLKFYKHASFVGSQGKGSELSYSATIADVIDWEMFFWVAQANTDYHIRVYRLEP